MHKFLSLSIILTFLVGCNYIPIPPLDVLNANAVHEGSPVPTKRSAPLQENDITAVATSTVPALETPTLSASNATLTPLAAVSTNDLTQTETMVGVTHVNLLVLTQGDSPGTWFLEGQGMDEIHPGDFLIIYGEPIPGTEVAIAQVQVIAQNPGSVLVQEVLVHLSQIVRSHMRADDNLAMLEESILIPAAHFADGYVLAKNRIRLRPGHDLDVGTIFQAFEPQKIGQRISDYLPFTPPSLMKITAIGVSGQVASAELLSGEWPQAGTLIANLNIETTPTTINTPVPETPPSLPTVGTEKTPTPKATIVAEQNQQPTAIAATLTAQFSASNGSPSVSGTPIPSARTIEILDPHWSDSTQGWYQVRWRYNGQLQPGQGFDLVLWYIDEDRRRGVADARDIAQKLERHGNNEYSVVVNLSAAEAAKQYCNAKYLLAITVVEIDPYRRIGTPSDAVQIQVAPLPGGPCR